MTPKTSVITVTCNRADYLAEAIASVEAQTDADWEHLIYNNAPRCERTLAVLRAAKARNPGKLFYASGSYGPDRPAPYWNVLLGLARGKYVTVLDDDNAKHPEYLAQTTAPLDADDGLDAVTCGWTYVDAEGRETGEDHRNQRTSLALLFRDNTIDTSALTFRASVVDRIGPFPDDLSTNEDWHFAVRLVRSCSVKHLPSALLRYRRHAGSRSQRAVALGAHWNWARIRSELFTPEEVRAYADQIRGEMVAGAH